MNRLLNTIRALLNRPFFIRLLHWEYWPSWAFYFPMLLYYPWLALRARHLCFFTAANPGIFTGGFGAESKYDTLMKIPPYWRPRTLLARPGETLNRLLERLDTAGIHFPIIAKPDIGLRGFLVTRVEDADTLQALLQRHPVDFLLQEYIALPEEIGVFYFRMPGEAGGHISSLTFKEFLQVRGNGRDTLGQLIHSSPRARLQWGRLRQTHSHLLNTVPAAGESVQLGEIGNHSKGTRFIDARDFIDEALVATFDHISRQIEGFYYGRFDIRCRSFEDLRQGKNFVILELNGVCSEPTHIYDAGAHSYGFALLEIIRHWSILYRVSAAWRRAGAACLPPSEMVAAFRKLFKHLKDQGKLTGN